MARWFDDYAGDLIGAGFDATDIRIACANWRTSDARRMASPGEMLGYCRKVFSPARVIEPPPPKPPPTAAEISERARVGDMLRGLAAEMRGANRMNFQQLGRRPGETGTQQAERLWPNHRTDRIAAKASDART